MAMSVPPSKFDTEVVPGAVKPLAKEIGAKSGEMLIVKYGSLNVLPDFNPRVTGTAEYEQGISDLAHSMLAEGFYRDKPLAVFVQKGDDGADKFYIADGHRRYAAVGEAIAKDSAFDPEIPVIVKPKGTTMEDLLIATMKTGAPLAPYEQGIVLKRLVNMGKTIEESATRLGMTRTYADNLLLLLGAPAKVRNAVMTGKISATAAINELKADPTNAAENIAAAVTKAVAEGRGKAKPKDVKAAGKERKASGEAKTPAPAPADDTAEADKLKVAYVIEMKAGEKGLISMPGFAVAQYMVEGDWYELTGTAGEFMCKTDTKIVLRLSRKAAKQDDVDTGGL